VRRQGSELGFKMSGSRPNRRSAVEAFQTRLAVFEQGGFVFGKKTICVAIPANSRGPALLSAPPPRGISLLREPPCILCPRLLSPVGSGGPAHRRMRRPPARE